MSERDHASFRKQTEGLNEMSFRFSEYFFDHSGPEASGADIDLFYTPVHSRPDFFYIRLEHFSGLIVCVGHIVAKHWRLPAHITLRHLFLPIKISKTL